MFRSFRLSLSTFAAVSVIFIGLLGEATPAAPVPTHLMPKKAVLSYPTAVGTKWVYDRNGGTETLVITNVEKKRGETIVIVEQVDAAGKTTPWHKLRLTEREWCWVEENGCRYDPSWCMLKFPSGEEYKWEFAPTRGNGMVKITGTSKQASRTQQVKVPAGVFEAVKVETTFSFGNNVAYNSTYWYASGVGLVKMDGTQLVVLTEFTPGKD